MQNLQISARILILNRRKRPLCSNKPQNFRPKMQNCKSLGWHGFCDGTWWSPQPKSPYRLAFFFKASEEGFKGLKGTFFFLFPVKSEKKVDQLSSTVVLSLYVVCNVCKSSRKCVAKRICVFSPRAQKCKSGST